MEKVLVYGASGFIGNALLRELINNGKEVIAVIPDSEVNKNAGLLLQDLNVKVVECNLHDVKNNLKKLINEEIDTCYYLAWDGLDNNALNNYKRQIDNVIYMLDLLTEVSKVGCRTFIGSGSITQQELLSEEGRRYLTDKHKYYRTAQQACEEMGKCLANELGMTFIWPLITNVYGAGENSPRFINTMIRKLLNNENVPTSEGRQLYDFVYIEDAVQAYIKLGEKGKSNRKYIIGSGSPMSLRSFLEIIEGSIPGAGKIEYGKFLYQGVYFSDKEYDISQLVEDTGYSPKIDFKTGIIKTAKWINGGENIGK